jgi:hypothetical protein
MSVKRVAGRCRVTQTCATSLTTLAEKLAAFRQDLCQVRNTQLDHDTLLQEMLVEVRVIRKFLFKPAEPANRLDVKPSDPDRT